MFPAPLAAFAAVGVFAVVLLAFVWIEQRVQKSHR